jgi:ribosomal-protein-alanine N-acetyltransferase
MHEERLAASVVVEAMTAEDIAAAAAIEALSFSLPWTEEMFAQELANPGVSTVLVARAEESPGARSVVGYICIWVVEEELHINNLAVHPRYRRRRIAQALLDAGLEHGHRRQASRAVLEVRASNLPALGLYRRYGFEPVGIRRQYYSHPSEDAVIMSLARIVCERDSRTMRAHQETS